MIQPKTLIDIVDNSGAKQIRCVKVVGGFKKNAAKLGDVIVASVQKLRTVNRDRSKVSKGDVVRALLIKTQKNKKNKDGANIRFNRNEAILLNKQNNLVGTRILSPIPRALKKKRYLKYFSLSKGTV